MAEIGHSTVTNLVRTVNVLGTNYTVECHREADDEKLKSSNGYTEPYSKRIVLEDIQQDSETVDRLDIFLNKVFRHEIIHAFLIESGLDCNSDWARNEEMVDWFALQFPKLYKAFKEAGVIDA